MHENRRDGDIYMCKILVADDSSTIQKVISMTLGDKNYVLESAMSEEDIYAKLNDDIDILLLDYGISTKNSGTEVAEEILGKYPHLKIVALLSTFDQIDRATLLELGFAESVTKPFDSTSFIDMVEGLLTSEEEIVDDSKDIDSVEDISDVEIGDEESQEFTEEMEDVSDADLWEVSSEPTSEEVSSEEPHDNCTQDSSIHVQLEDWGVEVPAPVEGPSDITTLPPKIEAREQNITEQENDFQPTFETEEESEVSDSNDKLPESEDLEYPDMEDAVEVDEEEDLSDLKLSSSMISADALSDTPTEELIDDEETDPNIQLSSYEGNLDELVSDETDGDDLWSVDEGLKVEKIEPINKDGTIHDELYEQRMEASLEDGASEVEKLEPHEEHEEYSILGEKEESSESDEDGAPTDEIIDAAVDETIHTAFNSFNRDEFLSEIREELRQEFISSEELKNEVKAEIFTALLADESFKQEIKATILEEMKNELIEESKSHIDKVAWEVIPDLAENLIKQEIKKISESL